MPELTSSQHSPSWESLFSQIHKHRLSLCTSLVQLRFRLWYLQGLGEDTTNLLFIISETALVFALGDVQSRVRGLGGFFVKNQSWLRRDAKVIAMLSFRVIYSE